MMGIGGAPEGVLASAALKCLGGNIQGVLKFGNDVQKERAWQMGITQFDKVYTMEEMTGGDVIFCATGVTDGDLVDGVKYTHDKIVTQSIVMRSHNRTISKINTEHPKERFE